MRWASKTTDSRRNYARLCIWEASSRTCKQVLELDGDVFAAVFVDGQRKVVSASDR